MARVSKLSDRTIQDTHARVAEGLFQLDHLRSRAERGQTMCLRDLETLKNGLKDVAALETLVQDLIRD